MDYRQRGDACVTAAAITGDTAQFSIAAGGGSFSLGLGGRRDITVRFSPTDSGTASAALRIDSNDPDHPRLDVRLSGSGRSAGISATQLLLLD